MQVLQQINLRIISTAIPTRSLTIKTSTNPESCHMSNFIRQNEVNMANEILEVQQPLLKSSNEMDNLRCITNSAHSLVTRITVMGTSFLAREIK